ncbi:MAG: DinB family protein [Planctomycetota bacterium]|jgi:uncharacterized damage-inducible protein DinB
MYTQQALLDLHERCHRSLRQCLDHCRVLSDKDLDRELDGFGYATVRLQLHHVMCGERYWITVARGCMDASEDEADAVSIDVLESFRRTEYETTREYLRVTTDEELSTPQRMTTWGGHEKMFAPAHVILRTQVHLFHHMGQIAAMCRLLGRPVPSGMDFPLT